MIAIGCLLVTPPLFPALAARSTGVGGVGGAGGARYSPPPLSNPSATGRLSQPNVAELDTLSQLDRLNTLSDRSYDIVPPANQNLTPGGPVPGYQTIRLGRGYNNRLYLACTVAGTKGSMMLDTGANNTSLSDGTYHFLLASAAARLPAGLPTAFTINGTRVPLAEAPDYNVGKSNLGAVPVTLIPPPYLADAGPRGSNGRQYDGLLGGNILRHYNAIIDCGRLVLYLDIDPARKLNLAASFVSHGWTRVPMLDTGTHFAVPCVLNGHKFRLIVDTGAPFTNLDRHLLAEAQIASHDLPMRSGLIGTQPQKVGLVELERLQIGNYTVTGVQMTTTSQSLARFGGRHDTATDAPIIGLLGGDVLANNEAVIDIGNKALYLKHPEGKASKQR